MLFTKAIVTGLVGALGVNALSSSCQAGVAGLAIGDLGQCLQLTSLLPVLSDSGSIVPDINTYLTSLCGSSTPKCSNQTLSSAQSSVQSSCSSDAQAGGTEAAEVQALQSILTSYPQVYAAACSKNSTNNDFCVVDTLNTVQTASGTNVTVDFLTSLLSGNGAGASSLQSLGNGQLCTGCVQGIYYQALQANSSISSTSVGKAITSQCGADFGSMAPSGVSTSQPSNTSSASASSTSGAANERMRLSAFAPIAVAGSAMLAAVAFGGAAVL